MLMTHFLCINIKTLQKLKKLNENFENICEFFVDNKFKIDFGNGKNKSILFASKRRDKNIPKLNVRYREINIK